MSQKIQKTNAVRLLERLKIPYRLAAYTPDENDLSALHLALQLGQDASRIFKTLVLKGDRTGYLVAVVPGDGQVNLKKAAAATGNKKVEMIPMKDLLAVTGYIRGGCSPLGMKKQLPTYLDSSAVQFDTIYISAGQRGLQIELAPDDLIRASSAVRVSLTE